MWEKWTNFETGDVYNIYKYISTRLGLAIAAVASLVVGGRATLRALTVPSSSSSSSVPPLLAVALAGGLPVSLAGRTAVGAVAAEEKRKTNQSGLLTGVNTFDRTSGIQGRGKDGVWMCV